MRNPNLVNMPLAAGMKLGDYDVVEMIGAGGMGEVLKPFASQITNDVNPGLSGHHL